MAAKKSIVMEKGKDWAIILTPSGEYKKIKTSDYLEVGERYQNRLPLPIKYVAAAVILLALILTGSDYFTVQAYAQVSTLAELGVNRWGRVVAIQSNNTNGYRILETVNVKNNKLELAVEKICLQALKDKQAQNELSKTSNFSVTPVKKAQPALEDKMLKQMNQGYQKAMHKQTPVRKINKIQNSQKYNNNPVPKKENITSKVQIKKSEQGFQKDKYSDLNQPHKKHEYRTDNQFKQTVPASKTSQVKKTTPFQLKKEIENEKDNFSKQYYQKNKARE